MQLNLFSGVFSEHRGWRNVFCGVFFLLHSHSSGKPPHHTDSLCGNLFKSPVYFFLNYLSFVDICYSLVTASKMIVDILAKRKMISYMGCMLQFFGVHFFGCTDIFILTVMAYDRYLTICKPLHYMTIMDGSRCNKILLGTWIDMFLHSIIQVSLVVQLPSCGPNEIVHYFCDVHPVLKLTCTVTYVVGVVVTANSGTIALGSFVILLISDTIIPVSLKAVSRRQVQSSLHLWLPHHRGHHLFWSLYFHVYPSWYYLFRD